LKICYLSENPLHLDKIMNYFASKGHDVSYITFKENNLENIDCYSLWEPIPRSYLTYFLNLYHVRKLLRKIKPDVIHSYYLTNFGLLGAFSGFKPFIVSAVGSDALLNPFKSDSKSWLITFIVNKVVRYVIKRSDCIISMATHMTDVLTKLGAESRKINQFSEGVDLDKFKIQKTVKRDSDKVRIISTRHLESVYNIEVLIDSIPLIVEHEKNIEFLIVGDGSLKEILIKKAEKEGVCEYIKFTGFIQNDKLPSYLNSSDIYVSTSFSDGCSVSLLEAMACGVFPIVSDITANSYIISEGVNGYLFNVKSSKSLAEKILMAINEPELRERALIKNHELIKNNFEMNLIMDRLMNIYKNLSELKYNSKS